MWSTVRCALHGGAAGGARFGRRLPAPAQRLDGGGARAASSQLSERPRQRRPAAALSREADKPLSFDFEDFKRYRHRRTPLDAAALHSLANTLARERRPHDLRVAMRYAERHGLHPDMLTFTALARALGGGSDKDGGGAGTGPEKLVELAREVKLRLLEPDVAFFDALIASVRGFTGGGGGAPRPSRLGVTAAVDAILAEMDEHRLQPDGATLEQLVITFARYGCTERAELELERLRGAGVARRAAPYDALIVMYARREAGGGAAPEAAKLRVLSLMRADGVALSHITLLWLARAHVQARRLRAAEQLLHRWLCALRSGANASGATGGVAVVEDGDGNDGHGGAPEPLRLPTLHVKIPDSTPAARYRYARTWVTSGAELMQAYAAEQERTRKRPADNAVRRVYRMVCDGVDVLLDGGGGGGGAALLEREAASRRAAVAYVRATARAGDARACESEFARLLREGRRGPAPSAVRGDNHGDEDDDFDSDGGGDNDRERLLRVGYTCLLEAHARARNATRGLEVWNEMRSKGVRPSATTLQYAVMGQLSDADGGGRGGGTDAALQLMREAGQFGVNMTTVAYNSLLNVLSRGCYASWGASDEGGASSAAAESDESGASSAAAAAGAEVEAAALLSATLEEMLGASVRPNARTADIVVSALAAAGELTAAEHAVARLTARRAAPPPDSYAKLMKAYAARADLEAVRRHFISVRRQRRAGPLPGLDGCYRALFTAMARSYRSAGGVERRQSLARELRRVLLRPCVAEAAATPAEGEEEQPLRCKRSASRLQATTWASVLKLSVLFDDLKLAVLAVRQVEAACAPATAPPPVFLVDSWRRLRSMLLRHGAECGEIDAKIERASSQRAAAAAWPAPVAKNGKDGPLREDRRRPRLAEVESRRRVSAESGAPPQQRRRPTRRSAEDARAGADRLLRELRGARVESFRRRDNRRAVPLPLPPPPPPPPPKHADTPPVENPPTISAPPRRARA